MEPGVGSPGVEPGNAGISDRWAADAHAPARLRGQGSNLRRRWLTASRSTAELPRTDAGVCGARGPSIAVAIERPVTELEPSSPRRQRGVLPLNERGPVRDEAEEERIELPRRGCARRFSRPLPSPAVGLFFRDGMPGDRTRSLAVKSRLLCRTELSSRDGQAWNRTRSPCV